VLAIAGKFAVMKISHHNYQLIFKLVSKQMAEPTDNQTSENLLKLGLHTRETHAWMIKS
jgi:hypothetical protein